MSIYWIGVDGIYINGRRLGEPVSEPFVFPVVKLTPRSANYANAGGRARNAALPKEVKGERGKLYKRT